MIYLIFMIHMILVEMQLLLRGAAPPRWVIAPFQGWVERHTLFARGCTASLVYGAPSGLGWEAIGFSFFHW